MQFIISKIKESVFQPTLNVLYRRSLAIAQNEKE